MWQPCAKDPCIVTRFRDTSEVITHWLRIFKKGPAFKSAVAMEEYQWRTISVFQKGIASMWGYQSLEKPQLMLQCLAAIFREILDTREACTLGKPTHRPWLSWSHFSLPPNAPPYLFDGFSGNGLGGKHSPCTACQETQTIPLKECLRLHQWCPLHLYNIMPSVVVWQTCYLTYTDLSGYWKCFKS